MQNSITLPYKICNFTKSVQDKLIEDYQGQPEGFVKVGPEKFVLTPAYEKYADIIYNFKARPDDVFISSHPRSGTTWTQEMVWLISNDLDYEKSYNEVLNKRFPYLERHLWANDSHYLKSPFDVCKNDPNSFLNSIQSKEFNPIYEQLAQQTTRRFIKTHFPIKLMPWNIGKVGAKVIYVARNPKDVSVSCYHFHKIHPLLGFKGDFKSFLEYFVNGLTIFGPYWKHVHDGWSHRNDENVFFVFYEDLKRNTEQTLLRLSRFLGKPLNKADLPKLLDHLEFENFKANPSVNYKMNDSDKSGLVRRGKIGGNPEMTSEFSKKIDDWIAENLKHSDLQFPLF